MGIKTNKEAYSIKLLGSLKNLPTTWGLRHSSRPDLILLLNL